MYSSSGWNTLFPLLLCFSEKVVDYFRAEHSVARVLEGRGAAPPWPESPPSASQGSLPPHRCLLHNEAEKEEREQRQYDRKETQRITLSSN
ncbi:hypothetical protein E2C01_056171 [Portunus trituberculatus]|uniref:Uncharacterized protein n=1 Tax=Portunus trituberculatus TaxID=210409 RepID=A0A5B7GPP1_PORTR|nr:hypothetical protein [Portunus trituberculatus]